MHRDSQIMAERWKFKNQSACPAFDDGLSERVPVPCLHEVNGIGSRVHRGQFNRRTLQERPERQVAIGTQVATSTKNPDHRLSIVRAAKSQQLLGPAL